VIDPLRIDVVELRRKPATRRSFRREATMPDLVVGSTFVPEDEPVSVELELESLSDGIVVAGTVRAPWEGECRRCLETVRGALEVEVHEVFMAEGDPDEIYLIEGDEIDLRPMVRDAVVLNLPHAPLCRPECRGPDPERYPTLVEGDEGPVDDRWAALSELRFKE
jgi:uncharacterized protein